MNTGSAPCPYHCALLSTTLGTKKDILRDFEQFFNKEKNTSPNKVRINSLFRKWKARCNEGLKFYCCFTLQFFLKQ